MMMKKEFIIFGMILVILSCFVYSDQLTMSITVVAAPSDIIITVCNNSSLCDFTDIQSAVNNASDGDTVYVYNGTYGNFTVKDKYNISIIGQSKDLVNIGGDGVHTAIVLQNVNNSILSGFNVYNGWQGVWIERSDYNSFGDILSYSNNNSGFILINSSRYNNLTNVESYNNLDNGIYIKDSGYNNIFDSKTRNNEWHGLSVDNSNNTYIKNHVSYLNNKNITISSGLYLYYSSNNTIINSNLSNNIFGIDSYGSYNNVISYNILFDNDDGISYPYLKVNDADSRQDNIFRNKVCDVDFIDSGCDYDYTAPSAVNDLVAYPGSSNKQIILNWTAVGDNWQYGSASKYIVKYSNVSEVNYSNWDSIADVQTISDNSMNGTKVSHTITMPNYGDYWFVMKAQDDAGLNSTISNVAKGLSPYYSISVDSILCVNGKNGYGCNDTLSYSNYLYDILNVSGNFTNKGNIDQTKVVEVKRNKAGWLTVHNKTMFFPKNDTSFVENLPYNLSDLNDGNYFDVGLCVDCGIEPQKIVKDAQVWSINKQFNVSWASLTDLPKPNGTKSNESVVIRARIDNINDLNNFYYAPITLYLNYSNFSLNKTGAGITGCDRIDCYVDIYVPYRDVSWTLNPLPIGTYNLTITLGQNSLDQRMIDRIVNISQS